MIANRQDYLGAGITYFPVSREPARVVKLLLVLSLALCAGSIAIYFIGAFSWLYILFASLLGAVLLYTSLRLVISTSSQNSWKLYKLSAFPFLGLLFLGMCLDIWLL